MKHVGDETVAKLLVTYQLLWLEGFGDSVRCEVFRSRAGDGCLPAKLLRFESCLFGRALLGDGRRAPRPRSDEWFGRFWSAIVVVTLASETLDPFDHVALHRDNTMAEVEFALGAP